MAKAVKHKKTPKKQVSVPEVVTDNVKLLFDKLTAPESGVVYDVAPRPKISDINGDTDKDGNPVPGTGSVGTFELRTGPTDVDSFHDFYRLQLAFEDVWTELTADAGIYQRWNALMDATLGGDRTADRSKTFPIIHPDGNVFKGDGVTPVTNADGSQLNIAEISGADDLKIFLDFLK